MGLLPLANFNNARLLTLIHEGYIGHTPETSPPPNTLHFSLSSSSRSFSGGIKLTIVTTHVLFLCLFVVVFFTKKLIPHRGR